MAQQPIAKPVFNPGNPISTDDLNKLGTLIENANTLSNQSVLKAKNELGTRIDKITDVQAGSVTGIDIKTDAWSTDKTISFNPPFTKVPSVNINVGYASDTYVYIRIKSVTINGFTFDAKSSAKALTSPTFYWIAAAEKEV
jgi:hypothetical protein